MTYAQLLPCAASVAALLLTSACDDQAQYPSCEDAVTVLDSLDSPTPAGPTVREVWGAIEGQRDTALDYTPTEGDAVHVEIEPGGEGSTALSLALTREADAEIRWIDSEEVYPTGPGPIADIAVYCPDRLEIDARLGFSTADGAFAELFDVVVTAEVGDGGYLGDANGGDDSGDGEFGAARIRQAWTPESLLGALEVVAISPANPDAVDYSIELEYPLIDAEISEGGAIGQPRGFVGGGAEYSSGKGKDATVSYAMFTLGTFGGWDGY